METREGYKVHRDLVQVNVERSFESGGTGEQDNTREGGRVEACVCVCVRVTVCARMHTLNTMHACLYTHTTHSSMRRMRFWDSSSDDPTHELLCNTIIIKFHSYLNKLTRCGTSEAGRGEAQRYST